MKYSTWLVKSVDRRTILIKPPHCNSRNQGQDVLYIKGWSVREDGWLYKNVGEEGSVHDWGKACTMITHIYHKYTITKQIHKQFFESITEISYECFDTPRYYNSLSHHFLIFSLFCVYWKNPQLIIINDEPFLVYIYSIVFFILLYVSLIPLMYGDVAMWRGVAGVMWWGGFYMNLETFQQVL